MQRTYRVPLARKGLVGLLALLVLLAFPGTSIAGGASESTQPAGKAETALLQRGSGYGADQATAARVRTVQRSLSRLGWQPGPVDGLFGPRTEAAVVAFQHNAKVTVDGIVGPQTLGALERARTGALKRGAGYAQPNGSPRVRTLQTRLRRLGLRPGPIDGLFGPRTEAAVIRFQKKGGLRVTGVATRRTARLLAAANAPVGTGSQPVTKAKPEPNRRNARPVAASPSDAGNGGSDLADVPVLIAIGVVALLVGAALAVLLARLRREDHETAVPLARSLDAEGWSQSRGAFRGRVHALVLHRGGLLRKEETHYLVDDPRKDGPFWVTHDEVRRLVEPTPPAEAAAPPLLPRPRPAPVPVPEPAPPVAEQQVKVIGYVGFRDSGELEGVRLQEQADEIAAVCDEHGWELLEVVRDVQETGDRGLERPGLRYALGRLGRGEASCLVVAELGGIARSASELSRLLDRLRAVDARLVAKDVELDTASPEARVAINALTAVGGWERETEPEAQAPQVQTRVAALRASQPRASRLAPVDAPAVKERIARMRSEGMTFQAIADQLNDEGVPTLGGGIKWRPSSVRYAANTAPRPPEEGGSP